MEQPLLLQETSIEKQATMSKQGCLSKDIVSIEEYSLPSVGTNFKKCTESEVGLLGSRAAPKMYVDKSKKDKGQ